MTSNAGSESSSGPLGFGKTVNEQSKDKAMKALQQFLRPEFLNRVDEVICFNQLSEENFRAIAQIMLKELQDVLKEKDLDFTWDEAVLDQLVKDSYSAAYGAALVSHTEESAVAPEQQRVYISHGDCLADAQLLAQMVRDRLHVSSVTIGDVGPPPRPGSFPAAFPGRSGPRASPGPGRRRGCPP